MHPLSLGFPITDTLPQVTAFKEGKGCYRGQPAFLLRPDVFGRELLNMGWPTPNSCATKPLPRRARVGWRPPPFRWTGMITSRAGLLTPCSLDVVPDA